MKQDILRSVRVVAILTVLTGLLYPLAITILAETLFPRKSSGSLIVRDGRTVGSALVAQQFTSSSYFWPRPSAIAFQPLPSGASNLGPTNGVLRDSVEQRRQSFIAAHPEALPGSVPEEMLTTSGSGIDPHISCEAALAQVGRVARARHLSEAGRQELLSVVQRAAEPPQWGVLGMERINVLLLNMALDTLAGPVQTELLPGSQR
jgi:K+-transporting ATPase ATPase C chain